MKPTATNSVDAEPVAIFCSNALAPQRTIGISATANHGLNQPAAGPASGTYEPGVEDYKVLKNLGWPAYTSSEAGTAWIFNGTTFWSFDTPATVATKMSYARAQGLGGAFGWELDGDDAAGSLVSAMRAGLPTL